DRTQANYYLIKSKLQADNINTSFETSWKVNNNERFLHTGDGEDSGLVDVVPLAPFTVQQIVTTTERDDIVVIGAYPNPFGDRFTVQFYVETSQPVKVRIVDLTGRVMKENLLNGFQPGINYLNIHAPELAPGNYILI